MSINLPKIAKTALDELSGNENPNAEENGKPESDNDEL